MKLKIEKIVSVYTILKDAKLTKMESADKFKVIKAIRPMQPIAEEWNNFISNVDKKLQKENHDEIIEKAQKWQREGEETTLSQEEKIEVNKYLLEYQKEKEACINDELEKEEELSFDKINDSAFEKLIDSNDWKVTEILLLESVIKE